MRFFLAFMLGTAGNLAVFSTFTWMNGTPVPSARTPWALLSYPTGSSALTLVISFLIYFLFLVICVLFPRRNNPAR